MAYSQYAGDDVLRFVGFAAIPTTYVALGGPLVNPALLVCVKNLTAGDVFIAITNGSTPASDGTADKWIIPAGGFELRDICSNKVDQPQSVLVYQAGTQFWVRQSTAPGSKAVYLEVMYGLGTT